MWLLIHAIGVLDVKRATRDEDCIDGRIIKQAVKQARAILVTTGHGETSLDGSGPQDYSINAGLERDA